MPYRGIIIEESLEDRGVLQVVTERHETPWVTQWTLHTVEIPEEAAAHVAAKLSEALDPLHARYADFKNEATLYIVFRNRVFRVDRRSERAYDAPRQYGMALGIPVYQLDFSPEIP